MNASLTPIFNPGSTPLRKRPAPFSLRLTTEEKEELQRRAHGQKLGSYIKAQLFGDKSTSKGSGLSAYHIAQILAVLGQAELHKNLHEIAYAASIGAIKLSDEEKAQLRDACLSVGELRHHLILALGVQKPK